jgi:ElaB/YqjD/DUF883 family membrane-anchored ribosome-binding protein
VTPSPRGGRNKQCCAQQTQAEGVANQIKGAAQDIYGRARDNAADMAGAARDTGASFERLLRNTIEEQPYTAVAIALGIGWLLGRLHRSL